MDNNNIKDKNKDIDRKRRTRKSIFITALAIVIIVTILSAILLAVRLVDYIKVDDRAVSLRSSMDDKLNVFAIEYKSATGDITVQGSEGAKVIAPGTDIEYTLRMRNVDKVAINYSFTPAVEFTSEHEIPILVRLLGPDDKYVIGSETEWIPIAEIGNVSGSGTLGVNETAEYVFEWKWPFESGDDAYDSFLGSANFAGGAGLDLSFNIHSEASLSSEENNGFFNAPHGKVVRIFIIALLLLIAIILFIIYLIKRIKANGEKKTEVVEVVKTVEVPVIQKVEVPVVKTVEVPAPTPVIVPSKKKTATFNGKMTFVNLDVLDENFESGDKISLQILKDRGIVPQNAKQLKILSRISEPLTKAFTVETQGISKEAEIAIRCAGGKVIITAPESGDKKH